MKKLVAAMVMVASISLIGCGGTEEDTVTKEIVASEAVAESEGEDATEKGTK